MKIVRLRAKNLLRLTAVDITPTGPVTTIGGANEAGKSSALNAIRLGMGGRRKTKDITDPIRRGADRAEIVIDLGEIVVERVITAGSERLHVRTKDGLPHRRPQEMLDQLYASIAFDPLEFTRQKPEAQAETLRQIVKLDLSALDQEEAEVFARRTGVGREEDRLAALAASAPCFPSAPPDEVSIADLVAELGEVDRMQAIHRANVEAVERAQRQQGELGSEVVRVAREIAAIKEKLAQRERFLADVQKQSDDAGADVDAAEAGAAVAFAALVDPAPVRARLAGAEETNRQVRANAQRAAAVAQQNEAIGRRRALTARLEAIAAAKREQLAAVRFPVDGLGFDPATGAVTYQGLPFSQASRAVQLRVSLAVGMSMNPDFRVLVVHDGAVLDQASLALVAAMAKEHDCDVWLEDNRTTDPEAIIIEDGHVLGAEIDAGEPPWDGNEGETP